MSRHHSPDETLDPIAAAELDALEAALTGDTTDPEWAAFVAAVRDEAPAPDLSFRRDLDERVAQGFPRARPAWLRLPARRMLPAFAVASTLLVGGVVVGTGTLDSDQTPSDPIGNSTELIAPGDDGTSSGAAGEQTSPGGTAGGSSPERSEAPGAPKAARELQDDASAPAPSAAPGPAPPAASPSSPPLAPPGAALGTRDRKVERSTTLDLTTDAGGLQDAADGIVRSTQDLGGVVERSQVDSSPTGGSASFVLRVPTARLDDALKRFGELADVAQLSQGAEDITGTFVSAQDRLSDARAERKALLAALGKATTRRSIASLRARIRANRSEIARLEGDLRGLRRRTDSARVDVTLRARGAASEPGAGGSWGPADAAGDALRVLEIVAGVALVGAAILLPLGLLGGSVALAGRGLRRRRREAALSAG